MCNVLYPLKWVVPKDDFYADDRAKQKYQGHEVYPLRQWWIRACNWSMCSTDPRILQGEHFTAINHTSSKTKFGGMEFDLFFNVDWQYYWNNFYYICNIYLLCCRFYTKNMIHSYGCISTFDCCRLEKMLLKLLQTCKDSKYPQR